MSKYPNLIITITSLTLASNMCMGQHVQGPYEDGSASSYTDQETGAELIPTIEEKEGKQVYTWPHWDQWKNGKMQVPDERTTHPDAQWWPEAGLGLFLCWGMPAVFEPNGEGWSGIWSQNKEDKGEFYPQTELWASVEGWDPPDYNPEKWMAAAARAGFKYSVLTMKHHGGYAMWDSDYAQIGVRQKMGGRDLVDPWVKACRHNDIKVGFYYSGKDWYFERETMNFSMQPGAKVNYKGEQVDSLPEQPADFHERYTEFNENQVKELIRKFSPDIWWGDAGHGATVDQIREWRPGIVCNNRGFSGGDHATPEGFGMSYPQFVLKPIVANGWWWEVNSIIQKGSWHYDKHYGEDVYPSDSVLMRLAEARSMGGNLLANIGPRPDGRIQEDAYRLFNDMAEWMDTNRDSVFGINGGLAWPHYSNVPVTCRDNVWFFHADRNQATKSEPIILKDIAKNPKSVTLMSNGKKLPYDYADGTLKIWIPKDLKALKVTDVAVVKFGISFDYKPFLFTNWH